MSFTITKRDSSSVYVGGVVVSKEQLEQALKDLQTTPEFEIIGRFSKDGSEASAPTTFIEGYLSFQMHFLDKGGVAVDKSSECEGSRVIPHYDEKIGYGTGFDHQRAYFCLSRSQVKILKDYLNSVIF